MEYEHVAALRKVHPAWKLLRADNAALILCFLGEVFADGNRGSVPAPELEAALDEFLYQINDPQNPDYPKSAKDYLADWADGSAGFLRRFYPLEDEVLHYEVTPAFEKAYSWVRSLGKREFVGTQSRLETVVEMLRSIVRGTETSPEKRLEDLKAQREAINAQIAAVEAGELEFMDETKIRELYQQIGITARELLSDFRQVEENFREQYRTNREHIVSSVGKSQKEVLDDLVRSRSEINQTDEGKSFGAFWKFSLSASSQEELRDLLAKVSALSAVDTDRRLLAIPNDWAEAADRTQRAVRKMSEQLRRFLDDWLRFKNRRVLDLANSITANVLKMRDNPPEIGMYIDIPGIAISLPFERPLYQKPAQTSVDSQGITEGELPDDEALFNQMFVDQMRLLDNLRQAIPPRASAELEDILEVYPIEQGVEEVLGYMTLDDDALEIEIEAEETRIQVKTNEGDLKTLKMPKVKVTRK